MSVRFWMAIVVGSLCIAAIWLFASPSHLILDEPSYLYIAKEMSWSRPYDWPMPWPPYHDNGFIFAHPPLFLWWVKWVGTAWWGHWMALSVLVFSVLSLTMKSSQNAMYLFVMWLCSAAVFLPGSRGLMPDLWVSALAMAAMWCFWEAQQKPKWVCTILGAIFLALASWVKYPAGVLLLVPLLHAPKKQKWLWFLCYVTILGFCEYWLFQQYGHWHLWEVLRTSPTIGHSSVYSRFFGVFARLGLSVLPVSLLVLGTSSNWKVPLCIAVLGGLFYYDEGWLAFGFAIAVFVGAQSIRLLGVFDWKVTWVWAILLVVVLGHNYTSPRYWMLVVWPLCALLSEQKPQLFLTPKIRWVLGISIMWVGLLWKTEALHAEQSDKLLIEAYQQYPKAEFSGEWTFRQTAESLEIAHSRHPSLSPILLSARNSAGAIPVDTHQKIDSFEGRKWWLHMVSADDSVGYYADTLGFLPIGISLKPIETVDVWKKK